MVITPQNPEYNFYEIPTEVQGMAIGATPQANAPAIPVAASNIVPGPNGSVVNGGTLESPNFRAGSAGYRLDSNGNLEANDGNFRGDITGATGTFSGTITATTGTIGGWSISSTAIYFDGATDAVSAGMAPADYPFYAGKKYADRATAPFKVEPSGKLTVTDIVATGVINAQSGYLSAGVYVDTVNGLLCESGGLNVGNAGHIRGGATDYATGVGFFLGYSGGAYKFSVGDPSGKYINWTGTDFVVNGFVVSSKGAFGGDGSDEALAITTGTTTLDVGAVSVYVKNYPSISITGDGKLAFSNPHANGTAIFLKSQGAVVLTSSTVPCIDASGMGGAGAATTAANADGAAGTTGRLIIDGNSHHGTGGLKRSSDATPTTGGTGGIIYTSTGLYTKVNSDRLYFKSISLACGSGGGGGGGGTGIGMTGGAGGNGGGILCIECGGALNFTGTISVAGIDGADAPDDTGPGTGVSGGGGGGGSAGMALILYNSLTENSGTINSAGGAGGDGGDTHGNAGGFIGGGGGAGAGCYASAGGNGATGIIGSVNGIPGSAAASYGAGGGGGSGATNLGSADPNIGGAGGAGGASDSGLVALNNFFV